MSTPSTFNTPDITNTPSIVQTSSSLVNIVINNSQLSEHDKVKT